MICRMEDLPEAWERPVFIITTGRSGSTLLLRYLNCAERLVVWGEHAGIMTDLAACHRKLALLRSLFAEPRFVLLVRNPAAVLKSKFRWFAAGDAVLMPEHVDDTLTFFECAQREVARGATDVTLVHYERLARDPMAETARLAKAIDCTFIAEQVRSIARERNGAAEVGPDAEPDLQLSAEAMGLPLPARTLERLSEAYRDLLAAEPAWRCGPPDEVPKPQNADAVAECIA